MPKVLKLWHKYFKMSLRPRAPKPYHYQIVLVQRARKPTAKPRQILGEYFPFAIGKDEQLENQQRVYLDVTKIKKLIAVGVEPSQPVARLLYYAGLIDEKYPGKHFLNMIAPKLPQDELEAALVEHSKQKQIGRERAAQAEEEFEDGKIALKDRNDVQDLLNLARGNMLGDTTPDNLGTNSGPVDSPSSPLSSTVATGGIKGTPPANQLLTDHDCVWTNAAGSPARHGPSLGLKNILDDS